MGRTLADGYIEIRPDVTKLGPGLLAGIRAINLTKQGQKAGADLGAGFAKGLADKGTEVAKVATATAGRLALVGAAAANAAPGVAQLTAALVPAAGAAAALPVAFAAIKVATATVKVAVAGVGEAIQTGFTGTAEQAKKALEELPPAAREFGRSIIALKPQVDALRASVAQRFFLPMQNEIKPLVNQYFPMITRQMSDLAGPLGGLGEQLLRSASRVRTFNAVSSLFDATATSAAQLRRGIDPLVAGFSTLIQQTVPFLPRMAAGLGHAAHNFGILLNAAAGSGRVTGWVEGGISTLKDLGAIFSNIGSIIATVYRAANAGGTTLLGNLRELTGQAEAFLKSAQGGTALTSLFVTLGQLGQAMRTSLAAVLPAVATSIQILAPAVGALAPAFAQLVVAVAPLLPHLTQIAAAVLTALVPAVAALASWVQRNQDATKTFVLTLAGVVIAIKAYAVYTKAAAVATAVWSVAQKAAAAAAKVWAGTQWLLNAALTANPIGLVIAAVAALAAAVVIAYRNSDTFREIVQGAWQGIQSVVSSAWNNVIKPVVSALVAYFRGVVAPMVVGLYNTYFKPAFAGIGFAVQAAWVVIQIAFKAFQIYLNRILIPAVRFLYDHLFKPVFSAIGGAISSWWNGAAKPTFNAAKAGFQALGSALREVWEKAVRPMFMTFSGFLKNTVAPAFDKGVENVRKSWQKIKEAARVPVAFVVNSLINPMTKGINAVAAFVGVKDRVPRIEGFARGGRIPGIPAPGGRDNRLAMGPNGPLAVAAGEWINRVKSTTHNLPLLKRVNSLDRPATMSDLVDVVPDGRARGGTVGDGLGDFFGRLVKGAKGLGDVILNPKKALLGVANAALGRIPGGAGLAATLRAMGSRLIASAGSWLDNKLGGAIGGAGVAGGWRGMQRLISSRFPELALVSGLRPGSRTLTGNRSYHASGRAVDYPPSRALAAWIRSTYGAKTKELITPFQDLNLLNGRPHRYTGAVWRQHNFAGGNAHVHWAAQLGGLVGKLSGMPTGTFDSGGYLPRGLSLAYNGTGRPEPVTPAGHFDALLAETQEQNRLLQQLLVATSGVGGDLAAALAAQSRRAVQLGRTGTASTARRIT